MQIKCSSLFINGDTFIQCYKSKISKDRMKNHRRRYCVFLVYSLSLLFPSCSFKCECGLALADRREGQSLGPLCFVHYRCVSASLQLRVITKVKASGRSKRSNCPGDPSANVRATSLRRLEGHPGLYSLREEETQEWEKGK